MAGIRAGTVVAGLTAAAVAAIAALAVQAAGAAPGVRATAPSVSPSVTPSASPTPTVPAMPADSGDGKRVVYSPGAKRVWLADAGGEVLRTYAVAPGSVSPAPAEYTVTTRSEKSVGGDGVTIEHVIRFASVEGVVIGFSSALDDAMPSADPAKRTGGIRETRKDGAALWEFAVSGTKVVVVP